VGSGYLATDRAIALARNVVKTVSDWCAILFRSGNNAPGYVSRLPQVLQLAQSGQARALAVTSAKRTALLPDVPTLDESGIVGFNLWSWWGIVGPAGMPANVVNALNSEIGKMLTSPELSRFLSNEGAEAETMTPQQFGDLMRSETERWIKVARKANISID
jgi:tripartite-type tricarboxylate transporter receptor subunit TctC